MPTMIRKHQNSTGTFGTVRPGGLIDLRRGRRRGIIDVAQQQQPVAQVCLMRGELRAACGVMSDRPAASAALHRRLHAAANPALGALHQVIYARHRLVDRTRGDQTQHPGHFTCRVRRARLQSGKPNSVKPAGRRLGVPLGFDGGDLHLLVLAGDVTGLVAQHHDRQRTGEAEARRHRHRALGDLDIAPSQQVPGADGQHEHRTDHVAGATVWTNFAWATGLKSTSAKEISSMRMVW